MKKLLIGLLLTSSVAMAADSPKEPAKATTWNLAMGVGVEKFDTPYIDEASLQGTGKIVTIDKAYSSKPAIWFTANWNIWGLDRDTAQGAIIPVKMGLIPEAKIKLGMFAGFKFVDENKTSLSGFTIGPQLSFDYSDRIYNLGIGYTTHNIRELQSGIEVGKPLDATRFSEIKFKEGSENAWMLVFSIGIK